MNDLKEQQLIFDNAVFSNFAKIGRLDLIFLLSDNIFTTQEVIEEVNAGVIKRPVLGAIIELVQCGKIAIKSLETETGIMLMDQLMQEGRLGIGEISTMAVASEVNGIFVTDDEAATKRAISLGISVLSKVELRDTVTILKILFENNKITEIEHIEIIQLLAVNNFTF